MRGGLARSSPLICDDSSCQFRRTAFDHEVGKIRNVVEAFTHRGRAMTLNVPQPRWAEVRVRGGSSIHAASPLAGRSPEQPSTTVTCKQAHHHQNHVLRTLLETPSNWNDNISRCLSTPIRHLHWCASPTAFNMQPPNSLGKAALLSAIAERFLSKANRPVALLL